MSGIVDIVREAYTCEIAQENMTLQEGLTQYMDYFVIIGNDGHLYSEKQCRCNTEHADVFRTKAIAEKEASDRIPPLFEIKQIRPRMLNGLEAYIKQKQKDYHPTRGQR
jgi:hypothetical protein